jgi:hypothetical protein
VRVQTDSPLLFICFFLFQPKSSHLLLVCFVICFVLFTLQAVGAVAGVHADLILYIGEDDGQRISVIQSVSVNAADKLDANTNALDANINASA